MILFLRSFKILLVLFLLRNGLILLINGTRELIWIIIEKIGWKRSFIEKETKI